MSIPSCWSGIGVSGSPASSASRSAKPGAAPSVISRASAGMQDRSSWPATGAMACEVRKSFASQSARMYSISAFVRCVGIGVTRSPARISPQKSGR